MSKTVSPRPSLIIITGLSGSGKGSALKAFEDLGYYCVDNLPIELIPTFAELCASSGEEFNRAAIVVDIREGAMLNKFPHIFRGLAREDAPARLIFLEASESALLRRFSETRRPHPLAARRSVREVVRLERRKMKAIRDLADEVIDTSDFTVHELRRHIMDQYRTPSRSRSILISAISFGYRGGLPPSSDLVFDVRFLPNPNFVPSYKNRTGKDAKVRDYVLGFKQTQELLRRLKSFLKYLVPKFVDEGKSYLTIAVGCTGGRHRSVVIAEEVGKFLRSLRYRTKVLHRDLR